MLRILFLKYKAKVVTKPITLQWTKYSPENKQFLLALRGDGYI